MYEEADNFNGLLLKKFVIIIIIINIFIIIIIIIIITTIIIYIYIYLISTLYNISIFLRLCKIQWIINWQLPLSS